ncbi:hypothetical protein WDW89_13115 [Deltaproteobacteria bacterium TL4]
MNTKELEEKEIVGVVFQEFLNSIGYKSTSEAHSYGNVLSIVNKIFQAAGHKHVLYLTQLRKVWLEKVDGFLAKNAYPRNISVSHTFSINEIFLSQVAEEPLLPQILQTLNYLRGTVFEHPKHLVLRVGKYLKRDLEEKEEGLILKHIKFEKEEVILHLVVYDGALAQTIYFEMDRYSLMLNQLLPKPIIQRIQCHVGDLNVIRTEQKWVSLLAAKWEQIIAAPFSQYTMPAYLHRISRREAILVVHTTSQAVDSIRKNSGEFTVLNQIYQAFPSLKNYIQRVSFVVQKDLDLNHTRAISMILGEFPQNKTPDASQSTSSLQTTAQTENRQQFFKLRTLLQKVPPSIPEKTKGQAKDYQAEPALDDEVIKKKLVDIMAQLRAQTSSDS